MFERALTPLLRRAARQYPIVNLTGPRQSGKTTLAKKVFPGHAYVSLEDPDSRQFALEDPRGFLAQFKGKVILDEIQRTPDLFSYLQAIVDTNPKAGQYILTGSQNFLLLARVTQSLAGRCAILHLLPLSHAELGRRRAMPLDTIGRRLPARKRNGDSDFAPLLHTGFYPRIHDKGLDAHQWLSNYYQSYVERDVREVVNVGDLETFGRFVRLCGGRSGQLLNLSSLGADCGVSHSTASRWLSLLQASFIVHLLRPHHKNFNKRLIKSPKLYFLDTGLLCYLLNIRRPGDLHIHSMRGPIFETFVVAELVKAAYSSGSRADDIYFWRDQQGNEIDILMDNGQLLTPIEVKSGQTIVADHFASLRFWRELPGQETAPASLVYGGVDSYMRNKVAVYSWKDWL